MLDYDNKTEFYTIDTIQILDFTNRFSNNVHSYKSSSSQTKNVKMTMWGHSEKYLEQLYNKKLVNK